MADSPWLIKKESFPHNGSLEEKIKFVLGYSILAPSTHNSQPWLFKIEGNSCKIYYDPKLKLPEADPKGRDLYISMGCMIENLIVAASYFGIFKDIDIKPSGNFIAEAFFNTQGEKNEDLEYLLDAIPKRANARGLFLPKSIPDSIQAEIMSLNKDGNIKINFVTDKVKIIKLAELTAQGLRMAHGRKSFRKEMFRWMHNSLTNKKDGMPGHSLRMPFFASFFIPRLVSLFDLSPLLAKLNYKSIASVPFICVFSSDKEDYFTWIDMGRLSERIFLHLNSKGIKTSIFIASVEMGELYKKVQDVLRENLKPQFLFCAGYMDYEPSHSPRHPVSEKIML